MTEELPRFLERMGLALLDFADQVKTSPDIDAKPIIYLAVDILNAVLAMDRAAIGDDRAATIGTLH